MSSADVTNQICTQQQDKWCGFWDYKPHLGAHLIPRPHPAFHLVVLLYYKHGKLVWSGSDTTTHSKSGGCMHT